MTMYGEAAYLDLCRRILQEGEYRKPENEEGRYELFAQPLKFDLRGDRLPLLTTKHVYFRPLAHEMLWFISGSQNIDYLTRNNVKIWNIWADKDGNVGPLYGYMWRNWGVDPKTSPLYNGATELDQLATVINTLRDRPEARSHMVLAWRPDWTKAQSIKPCHVLLQFYRVGDEVSLALYQRSCDTFLGVPFNIAQYSLLCHMVAHLLGCKAREFTWVGGDVHIYENHVEQVRHQLRQPVREVPTLHFARSGKEIGDMDGYLFEDFIVEGYEPGPKLKGDVSPQGTPGEGVAL